MPGVISICNMLGETVLVIEAGFGQTTIDISSFAAGVYSVKLTGNDGKNISSDRIVKM